MKVLYNKRRVRANLILSVVWLTFSIVYIIVDDGKISWIKYGWLLLALAYIALYAYQHHYQYLTLADGVLKINNPFFGKKIKLSEIKKIRYFAGDYKLKAEDKELTINTKIIDPDSLAEFVTELEKLDDVEWT